MSFTYKPSYVDFGHEPSVKKVKFVHDHDSIAVSDKPVWIDSVSIADVSGKGTITLTVGVDSAERRYDGFVTITGTTGAVTTDYIIQVVYSYDSNHIPLVNVVDNVILMGEDTSHVTKRDRLKCMLAGKRWLQDNNHAYDMDVRFAEVFVDGNKAYPPGDFVDYYAVYVVTTDGYLRPVYKNDNINISEGYIKDNDGLYVLDQNGIVTGAYGTTRPLNVPPSTYYDSDTTITGGSLNRTYYNVQGGELSGNGMYTYDRINKVFMLNGIDDSFVVIQYRSDPLLRDKLNMDTGGIKVHTDFQDTLEAYIYHKVIERAVNVTNGEKARALKAYSLAYQRAIAKKRNIPELIQALRGNKRYFTAS